MAIIQIGVIESLDGQVSVMHVDGSTELLQAGSAIYAGDTVITAEEATAGIRFLDGSLYTLGPEFTARLDSDIFDPAGFVTSIQSSSADGAAAGFVTLSHAGVVTALAGDVDVIHADGSIETLHTGDFVYTDDVIRTSAEGSADLKLLDGSLRHVGPGSMTSLGDGVPAPGVETPTTLASARADAADIVQSILEGEDPTETAEAPAAGEEAQEDSGTSVVRLEESGRRVTPESGYETTGIGYGFTDVDEELLQTPTNRAPQPRDDNTTGADDDVLATKENTPITIDAAFLLANDSDPDGDSLTLVSVGNAVHGTVELLGDQVLYTPDPGFYGMGSFQYTVTDGSLTASAKVRIDVDSLPDTGSTLSAVDESELSPGVSTGPQTVSADFGDDIPGEINGNGSFTASTTLTSAGQPVTVSVDTDGNYTGTVNGGSTTVFTLAFDPSGTGYQFTLEQPIDHPDSSDPDDTVSLDFGYTATDSNGDVAAGSITVVVSDDGPSVSAAGINTQEETPVSFNVFDHATPGADGAILKAVSLAVADDGVITTFDAGGNVTYTPAPGYDGIAVINYTIEDGDGDQASGQFSISVGTDSVPSVSDDSGTVDESALGDGSGGGTHTTGGALSIDTGGDMLAGLKVNGEAVSPTGTTLITGVYGDLSIDIDGNWSYTLSDSTTDHTGIDQTGAADQVQESFSILVTDSDGDTAGATLTINVNDDGPVAVSEGTVDVNEGTSVIGNLLANDTQGADGATLTHVNGDELVFDALSGDATVVTSLGTLLVKADGGYSYSANDNSNGTDVFTYTLTDADGDSSQSTVSFALQDANMPVASDSSGTVEESALADGSDESSPNESTSGVLNFSSGEDKPYTLEVNGTSVSPTGTTLITGVYGDLSIDIDGNWSYTLSDSTTDHTGIDQTGAADQVQESFGILVTDSDGDTAGATLTINVNDDGPVASAGSSVNVDEGATSASSSLASLVSEAGADGATVTAVNGSDLTGTGTVTAAGSHGSLIVDLDNGTFEYQANDNDAGMDVFTFTVTDGDQDTDSVDYSYTVVDANEPVAGDLSRTVDEAALATGSDPASDNESTSGNLADLGVSFNGDVPGSLTVGTQSILIDGNGGETITVSGTYGDWLIHDDGSWTYTLNVNTTAHSSQGSGADDVEDVFSYIATDSDGDQTSGSLKVSVQDDVPTAIADPATVELRDGDTSASSTLAALIAVAGADGASVTSVNGMDLAGAGIVVVDGDNGSLVVNLDNGTYTYNANTEDTGSDNFVFTITDGDGDTDTVAVSYVVSDRPNFATDSYVWLPVDQAQQAPGYEAGYPIGLELSDLDSTLTVTITEVADDGQAGYYDDNNAFVPLNVGDTFTLAVGELMPQIVYIPPDVDLDTVVDPITDIVSFTVTEDGDPLTTQSGTININAMPPYDLPSQEVLIGDGSSPLTSGNDLEGELVLDNNLVTAITRDIGNDDVINSSVIELFTDFQEKPSSGGVPIPAAHRADAELEATVTAKVIVDGIEFVVIAENDAESQWAYDSDSGLMKAVVDYNDVISADAGIFDGSLADYLAASPPDVGDTWTVIYQDSGPGNEQARFIKFNFSYDNPGDPSINVIGGADAPNIIYGSSGDDILTGGGAEDEIYGRGGDDVLVGGAGDDIVIGGDGDDQLNGDSGADRFVIRSLDEGVDSITDYSNNESDVLDISDLLTGFDPNNDALSDFVSITSDGADATVAVDPSGAGSYADIALLSNITAGTLVTIQISEDTTETLIVG